MSVARRLTSIDDDGEVRHDFLGVERAVKSKRVFRVPLGGFERRVVVLRAIRVLQDHGFKPEEIAIATGQSERTARRKRSTLRQLAEAQGRV